MERIREMLGPNMMFAMAVLRTGVLSQSSGSAYIEQGSTKVIVGVHGPREIPRRSDFSMKGVLACHVQLAPFSAAASRRAPGVDHEARELANIVKEALEATVCLVRRNDKQDDLLGNS